MLKDSNVISLQISTADIMQQIVWIGSSSIRTVRTFVPKPGIPGILGVRVTPTRRILPRFQFYMLLLLTQQLLYLRALTIFSHLQLLQELRHQFQRYPKLENFS